MIEACRTCIDLLNGALSLTARGRTLYGSQHRTDTLALPNDAEGWQVSGYLTSSSKTAIEPTIRGCKIETRRLAPKNGLKVNSNMACAIGKHEHASIC